jgi:hypothetical protein
MAVFPAKNRPAARAHITTQRGVSPNMVVVTAAFMSVLSERIEIKK